MNELKTRINKCINEIRDTLCTDSSIIEALEKYFDNPVENDLSEDLISLIADLRQYYVENHSTMYDLSILGNPKCEDVIVDAVKKTLIAYDKFQIFRDSELSIQDKRKILENVFYNKILRNNPVMLREYTPSPFNHSNSNEFDFFTSAYSQIVYDCVSKLFIGETLHEAIKFNAGFEDELVSVVEELIEKNIEALKLNYIIMFKKI